MQHYQPIPYAGPSSLANANGTPAVPVQEPAHQQQLQLPEQHPQQSQGPLVATGDWTKDLVHLAKTAELKKHALTLQLHTAHILSAHASLEQKTRLIQDLQEQKNKLDSERAHLLNSLRQINEDRDKADLMEVSLAKECADLRLKISQLTDGEYAVAKRDVDRLRAELGQPPLPSLQSTLEEKSAQYLTQRRLEGEKPAASAKRAGAVPNAPLEMDDKPIKRPRGRPKGSKNRGGKTAQASTAT